MGALVRPDRHHAITAPLPFSISCIGKQAFDSHDHAASVIATIRKRNGRRQGGAVKPYRCTRCGAWHVGGSHEGMHR